MLAILLIPAALTFTYGKMVGSVRHGWTIFTAMFILLLTGLCISLFAEYSPNPFSEICHNMEGKKPGLELQTVFFGR